MNQDHSPKTQCPRCEKWVVDMDGFGVLAHEECGYCSHPSRTGDICDICQDVEGANVYEKPAQINIKLIKDVKLINRIKCFFGWHELGVIGLDWSAEAGGGSSEHKYCIHCPFTRSKRNL